MSLRIQIYHPSVHLFEILISSGSISGYITRHGFRVASTQIFWYVTLEALCYMYNGDLSDRYVRLPENDVDLPENYADLFNKYMQIYLLVVINFFSDKSYQ